MDKKIRVGILCGGKSAEHEVSLQSAQSILKAIDQDKYEPVLIGIDKSGGWSYFDTSEFLINASDPEKIMLGDSGALLSLAPGTSNQDVMVSSQGKNPGPIDVIFPVLHGPMGEDGTVQGMLTLADLPYVGAGVLGSAVGMDKDVMKRLLRDANLPIGGFFCVTRETASNVPFDDVVEKIGLPMFVKPANCGSSVGISKVSSESQYKGALDEALKFDHKIILEENIPGREIECSVLGNENPIASIPGEVIPTHEFYSYEAKYLDENGAGLEIPADLPQGKVAEIQRLAIDAFKTLECQGMARVDLFLKENGELILNEINTIPGFTKISMYPQLWEASGIPYPELIDRLIQLAIDRHKKNSLLQTSYV